MTGFTVLMLFISASALADEPVLTGVPISAADDSPGNLFGGSVSVSGDYALVGASGNSAAYVFVRDGDNWSQQAKLTVQGEVTEFGWPVSIDGDYALVGALNAAYIFARDGDNWSRQAELVPDNDESENFGDPVALSGDYALVGDISDSGFAGAVYVFRRNGNLWEQTKLTGSDTQKDDMFGASLAFSGDYAVIGAYDSEGGTAYLFQRGESAWAEVFRRSGGAYFAEAVGISDSGDYVIISNDASSPVILKKTLSAWEDQDTAGISSFSAVSISGDNACAVSRWTSRAYLTKRYDTPQADEWELYHPGEVEGFGASVSVSGDYCVVGADNSGGQERGGVAYIYDLTQFHQGDANADKSVTLADAVLCLKIVAGISDQSVTKLADVDGNGQIGLEEAVFVLESLAK